MPSEIGKKCQYSHSCHRIPLCMASPSSSTGNSDWHQHMGGTSPARLDSRPCRNRLFLKVSKPTMFTTQLVFYTWKGILVMISSRSCPFRNNCPHPKECYLINVLLKIFSQKTFELASFMRLANMGRGRMKKDIQGGLDSTCKCFPSWSVQAKKERCQIPPQLIGSKEYISGTYHMRHRCQDLRVEQ